MLSHRSERIAVLVILVTSAILRFGVAAWNQDANDDHLPVLTVMLTKDRLPHAGECWECFQPKLWYVAVAGLTQLVGAEGDPAIRTAAQMLNVVASLLAMLLLWKLMTRLSARRTARTMAFALFALNPKWIGISAQATNDSFVILFFTLCLFFASAFFSTGRSRDFAGMALGAILAALSKGNGILLPAIIIAAFAGWGIREARAGGRQAWTTIGAPLLLFVSLQLLTVPFLGQYYRHHQLYGTPFVTNFPVQPLPPLFDDEWARRPGITSVAKGYFTFRFASLLGEPRVGHDRFEFPAHRTSLWSQIYGRTHSLHFDDWPKSWQSSASATDWITRAIFVLALIPTLLLLVALARSLVDEIRASLPTSSAPTRSGTTVLVLAALAGLAFVVLYSARYRDYSTMKAIFLFPALAGWFFLQIRGLEWLEDENAARAGVRYAVRAAVAALVLLYVADVAVLIYELAARS